MSESYNIVTQRAINLKIVVFIRFCMADKLNGQRLPVHRTEPYINGHFQNDGASRYFGGWLWQLVHFLILFCSFHWRVLCLCLIKTLVEHLYCDEGLLFGEEFTEGNQSESNTGHCCAIMQWTDFIWRDDKFRDRHPKSTDFVDAFKEREHLLNHQQLCELAKWTNQLPVLPTPEGQQIKLYKINFTAVRSDCGWSTIKIWQHEDWISLHQWSVMQRQIISNYSFSSLWLGAVNTASTPECCSWWKTGNGRVPGSMRDKLDFSHNMKIKYFGNIVEKGWKIQFQ